jgi:anti-anti-sigma regulatory factor
MDTQKVKFQVMQRNQKVEDAEFGRAVEMSIFNTGIVKQYLKKIITRKGTQLDIDLSGIHSINEDWIDTFNFLSRMARKYNSSVRLIGVEKEVLEMIELIRKYYHFDIQHVKPAC